MSWIKVIDEEGAMGELQELYDNMTEPSGEVDNILKVHSLNPASLRAHFDLYVTLMRGKSGLSRIQREMIGVVTSAANHCHY